MEPRSDDEALARLERRYRRETQARREAEAIAERVTGELYAATVNLQAANQAIRDFVAVASHDLKNPLTAILGSAGLMRARWDDLGDDRKREFIELIERQATRLSRMVDDLLTLSRIESGALEPHAQAVELRQAIETAIEDFAQNANDISVDAPDGLGVLVDPDHLHRILANYVGNAIKYGAPPVEVHATRVEDWIEIRVVDHGDGVPADFVPRLFGKFARAGDAKTQLQPGTGLGLSIVRGLALLNGGETWYEPGPSNGSCFCVRLRNPA